MVKWVAERQNEDPVILMYDYLFYQWGWEELKIGPLVSGGPRVAHIVDWRGEAGVADQDYIPPVVGDMDGNIYRESPTLWSDEGEHVPVVVETAWIKLSRLQGFHRFKSGLLMVRGEIDSLQVEVAYSTGDSVYPTTYTDTFTYAVGPGTVPAQMRIRPSIQKCDAI